MGHEVEVDLVGPLQLDRLAREDEIRGRRWGAGGDGDGLGVDMDLDVVGDVVDGGGVGCDEVGLGPDEGRHDALQKDLGVDKRDAAQGGVGGVLPEVVVDDEELERAVGDGHFEQRTGPVLAGAVSVV